MSETVLKDILPDVYYQHWSLLINAYRVTLKTKITKNDIAYVEKLLRKFVDWTEQLYGKQFITIKIHQLIHIPDALRNYGPLRNISAYPFEDLNGDLIDKNTATNHPIEHLHDKYTKSIFLRTILHSMRDGDGKEFHKDHPFVDYLYKYQKWKYDDSEVVLKKTWHGMNKLGEHYSYKHCKKSPWIEQYDTIMSPFKRCKYSIQFNAHEATVFEVFKIGSLKFNVNTILQKNIDSTWIIFKDSNGKTRAGSFKLGITDGSMYIIAVETFKKTFKSHTLHCVNTEDQKEILFVDVRQVVDQGVLACGGSKIALHALGSDTYSIPEQTDVPVQYSKMQDDVSYEGIRRLTSDPSNRHDFRAVSEESAVDGNL